LPAGEHVPPDATACIIWLKNRRPDRWRNVQNIEAKMGKDHADDQGEPKNGRHCERRIGPAAERMALVARLMPVSLLACARTMAR
jgi:hypothetical protein